MRDNVGFRTDSAGFLKRISAERGDVACFRLGVGRAVLFSHPDAVRDVLVDNAAAFGKGKLIQRARRLLGDGLLTSEGEPHRRQRRRIQPAFSQQMIARYAGAIPALTTRHAQRYVNGGRISLVEDMDALAMSVVAKTLLGADIIDRVPAISAALHTLARWAPFLMLPGANRIEHVLPVGRALRTLEETIAQLIASDSADSPLLHALLHSHNGEGAMSPQLARDEVMTIFMAGHDTTAAALTWTWILLAEHPDVRDEMERELCDVTSDDIAGLPYLDAVIREVLRLYPPISRIGRRPIEDMTLCGERVAADTAVFVSPYVTHRDARWFEQPDQFLPERWIPAPSIPKFSYFPFGAGPRSCIGEHFARRSIAVAVATMLREWRLTPEKGGVPKARALLTLKPRRTPFTPPSFTRTSFRDFAVDPSCHGSAPSANVACEETPQAAPELRCKRPF